MKDFFKNLKYTNRFIMTYRKPEMKWILASFISSIAFAIMISASAGLLLFEGLFIVVAMTSAYIFGVGLIYKETHKLLKEVEEEVRIQKKYGNLYNKISKGGN